MTTINLPISALTTEPVADAICPTDVVEALKEHGIELGAFDIEIARWIRIWDAPTILTVLSWVHRAALAAKEDTELAATEDTELAA